MIRITEYLTTKVSKSKIKATDDTIQQIVKEEMDKYGHNCDLNHVDVSEVMNMDNLFSCDRDDLGKSYSDLNPDISEWNVSNVKRMRCMFWDCEIFNSNISKWDVSNVINMEFMFYKCKSFNQDIGDWDVSNVTAMKGLFIECSSFNQNIGGWDVSNVTDMYEMFFSCKKFNQDLSKWNVTTRGNYMMFYDCPIEEKYKPHFNK